MAKKQIASPFGAIKTNRSIIQNQNLKQHITILPELKDLIPPLTEEEIRLLEESIQKDGCREPLTVWERTEGNTTEHILIDGHNRYRICQQFGIDFKVKTPLFFESIKEVKDYMIDLQMGRRNLSEEQKSYLRGLRYNNEKTQQGGARDNNLVNKKKELSEIYNVGERTIVRDGEFAKGLEKIGEVNPDLKDDILRGESPLTRSDVQKFARVDNVSQLQNIGDVSNFAQVLKETSKPAPPKSRLELLQEDFFKESKSFTKKKNVTQINRMIQLLEEIKKEL